MPGSGKSTIGKLLGQRLGCKFSDLDTIIEKELGKSINEVFLEKGASFFRDYEAATLRSFVNSNDSFLLATGGGTPCFRRSMNFVKSSGISIYLSYDHEVLASRIWDHGFADRPLLKNLKEKEKLEEKLFRKLKIRSKYYERADITLNLSSEDHVEVLELILSSL
jgi:shikimate kinase